MKLRVLIPSRDYENYAGARIRYGRLAPELERHGIVLTLQDIGEFVPEEMEYDALLISKCHDARALVVAAAAYARGQLVGVDLFDDYFSQAADSRLIRYRRWLKQLLKTSHFALCSTNALAEVVEGYAPGFPVHVVNDPAPPVDFGQLSNLLTSKLAKARAEMTIRLVWFGVGDNPHFNVGLSDLAAYGGMLRTLGSSGMDVELTVLTNARALTSEGLALVRQVPVRTSVEEWSEAGERDLLAKSFACFLPVNAQRFSAAKSLNRAVTALSAGCQVISAGYPLYSALGQFLYRDTATFVEDFALGKMRHSAAAMEDFGGTLAAIASSAREAAGIAEFLGQIEPSCPEKSGALTLVHGQSTNGVAHKMARSLHGYSVGSPYCAAKLGFDVIFRGAGDRLQMLISEHAAKSVTSGVEQDLQLARSDSGRRYWIVSDDGAAERDFVPEGAPWHDSPLPFQMATYGSTMTQIAERMENAFGPCRIFLSESSHLPFSVAV